MSEADIILQPWDHYPRPFTVVQNGQVIYKEITASVTIKVDGEIEIHWAGYFDPTGKQIGADSYSFSTQNCVAGERINFNYSKLDPSKPDSVVAFCNGSQPSTTISIIPPVSITSTTTLIPTTTPNLTIPTSTSIELTTATKILPETGIDFLPLLSVGILSCAVGLYIARKFDARSKR